MAQISFTGGNTISVSAGGLGPRYSNNQAILGQILFFQSSPLHRTGIVCLAVRLERKSASVSVSGGILAYSGVVTFSDDVLTMVQRQLLRRRTRNESGHSQPRHCADLGSHSHSALRHHREHSPVGAGKHDRALPRKHRLHSLHQNSRPRLGRGKPVLQATSNRVSIADVRRPVDRPACRALL